MTLGNTLRDADALVSAGLVMPDLRDAIAAVEARYADRLEAPAPSRWRRGQEHLIRIRYNDLDSCCDLSDPGVQDALDTIALKHLEALRVFPAF